MRLCIRIAPQFMETADVVRTTVAGTEVVIKSKHGGPPTGTDWVVLEASGFPTKESAREYGTRLRTIVRLTGMCSGPGVDTGRDSPTSHGMEDHLTEIGLMQPGQIMVPDVHGIYVYPDDGNYVLSPDVQATVTVESSPTHFAKALRHISNQDTTVDTDIATAIILLNYVRMSQNSIVRFLLSIVAVEPLGKRLTWSTIERAYLKQLAAAVRKDSELDQTSQDRIAEAIQNSLGRGPTGLKQGVVLLLTCLGLHDLKDEWKKLYDERSKLIHGRKAYDVDEVARLATRASKLANAVVSATLRKQGVMLPSNAELTLDD